MSGRVPPFTAVITDSDPPIRCGGFSIVGQRSNDIPGFVTHVALTRSSGEIERRTGIEVFHVCPPISAGNSPSRLDQCDLIADLALDQEETASIETWRAGVDREVTQHPDVRAFQQYTLIPHVRWHTAENGRRIRRRFSCIGFVTDAYESAGIQLLDPTCLPQAGEHDLRIAFPDLARLEAAPPHVTERKLGFKGRSDLGILGSGPWPVMLPGYAFQATERATAEHPRPASYRPTSVDDAYYPRRANPAQPTS